MTFVRLVYFLPSPFSLSGTPAFVPPAKKDSLIVHVLFSRVVRPHLILDRVRCVTLTRENKENRENRENMENRENGGNRENMGNKENILKISGKIRKTISKFDILDTFRDFLYLWRQALSRFLTFLAFGVKPSAEFSLFWILGSSPHRKIDFVIFDVKPSAEF